MTKKITSRKDILVTLFDEPVEGGESSTDYLTKREDNQGLLKDPLVLSILGLTALTNSAYAIIAPFLPFEFKQKGIDQTWIGYIFSIYSVAVIICSPIVGKMISIIGRRNLIVFGVCLMGCSFIVFGIISNLEDKNAFITLALLNRFLQGFASSLIQTTMYSISTNFFPDHKDAMVGYIEAITGVGLILGPLIGSGLYAIGGYKFIFFSFGSFFVLSSFFIKVVFGTNIDAINTQSDVSGSNASSTRSRRRRAMTDDFMPVAGSTLID